MPGSTPATSQLDWLISTTAMIVLSWSKATRDLLKSFSWGIGALRQLFASDDGAISSPPAPYHLSAGGRWIRTIGTPPNFFGRPHLPAQFTFRNINRFPRDRDRWFESISLQQRVCELSVPERRGHFPARTP